MCDFDQIEQAVNKEHIHAIESLEQRRELVAVEVSLDHLAFSPQRALAEHSVVLEVPKVDVAVLEAQTPKATA